MANPPSLLSKVTVDATNDHLDFKFLGGAEQNVVIDQATYNDMWEVVDNLQGKIRTLGGNYAAWNVDITTAGKVIVDSRRVAAHIELLWKTGVNGSDNLDTHCGHLLGFVDTSDDTSDYDHTSDYQHMYGWYSVRYPHTYGPLKPKAIGGEPATTLSGKNEKVVHIGFHNFYEVGLVIMVPEIVLASSATGANTNRDFETVWKDAIAGNPVRWREDQSVEGTYITVYLQEPRSLEDLTRPYDDYAAYDLRLKFRRQET